MFIQIDRKPRLHFLTVVQVAVVSLQLYMCMYSNTKYFSTIDCNPYIIGTANVVNIVTAKFIYYLRLFRPLFEGAITWHIFSFKLLILLIACLSLNKCLPLKDIKDSRPR